MTKTLDLADLRAKALAATPGPWRVDLETVFDPIGVASDARYIATLDAFDQGPDERMPDAAFIAAASPSTVLALLDEIERMRDDANAAVVSCGKRRCSTMQRDRDDAESEVERLAGELFATRVALTEACDIAADWIRDDSEGSIDKRIAELRKLGTVKP